MPVPYQDAIVDGKIVTRGYRNSAPRFDLIKNILQAHCPPNPTVIDFGANGGYFSYRLAAECGAQVNAIDDCQALKDLRRNSPHPGLEFIHRRLTPEEVSELPKADLVLCLSVLHHNLDWAKLLVALRGRAKGILVVESAHPDEPLKSALARQYRGEIIKAVEAEGILAGTSQGVRSKHQRPIHTISGGVLRGTVFAGSGNCGKFWSRGDVLAEVQGVLGYEPHPGSLNVKLNHHLSASVTLLLGKPRKSYWDQRRDKDGKKGGDYQFWPAKLGHGEHSVEGHVMVPGVRSHGHDVLEVVAPLHLREAWELQDGDAIWVRLK